MYVTTHLVVDDMVVEGTHGRLTDSSTVSLLSRLPVATLQVAGSGEADLDGTVNHEDVVEHWSNAIISLLISEGQGRWTYSSRS